MQNMEKYFGFKVKVSDFLEPEDIGAIRSKISALLEQDPDSSEQYKIYLHQLVVEAKATQFGFGGGISGRLSKIYLRFTINQKQRNNGDIKFMNYRFGDDLQEEASHYYFPHEIGYTLLSSYFDSEKEYFQNVLVTLVRTSMREEHKKIKVRVSVDPRQEYLEKLKNKLSAQKDSKFDIDFRKVLIFNKQTKFKISQRGQDRAMSRNQPKDSDREDKSKFTLINNGTISNLVNQSDSAKAYVNQTITTNPVILEHLIKDLKTLLASTEENKPKEATEKEIATIEGVLVESGRNPEALLRLKSLGGWALQRADKMGLNLLTEFLKGQLGL